MPDSAMAMQQQPEQQTDFERLNAWHLQANLITHAESLQAPTEQSRIAMRVYDDYEIDFRSAADWRRDNKAGMDLARLVSKTRTYAGENVSSVIYPMITSSAIQFASRAYPNIVKGSDVVKAAVIGYDPEGEKKKKGERISRHMSDQVLNRMPGWEADMDQLLILLPICGSAFKKTYYDGIIRQNVSKLLYPDELVVQYSARSMEDARRVTQKVELTKNEIVERLRSGIFVGIDPEKMGSPAAGEWNEGRHDPSDEDAPHLFLEQHRWLDLDKDGYEEPYIVTIHYDSQTLVRIAPRFDIDGIQHNEKGQIVRIEPVHYFTRYLFMPDPEGGFYGMGFARLLKGSNEVGNTLLNQLLDAGTRSVRQGGLIGKALATKLGGAGAKSLRFKSGEWKFVNATGDDLRKNIFPIPVSEPSNVLFQLFQFVVDMGKDVSAMTDALRGDKFPSNLASTTVLAIIEQALTVYTGIYKRVHRGLKEEFAKILRLNKLYLDQMEYRDVLDHPEAIAADDYDSKDYDIVPVSDPTTVSSAQRLMKAEALLQLVGKNLDDREIYRRYMEALQIEEIEKIVPEEAPPNPLQEMEMELKRAEIATAEAERQFTEAKIQTERVKQQTELDKIEIERQKLEQEERKLTNEIAFEKEKLEGEMFLKRAEMAERIRILKEPPEPAKKEDAA